MVAGQVRPAAFGAAARNTARADLVELRDHPVMGLTGVVDLAALCFRIGLPPYTSTALRT
jgi:hypothetical protein